MVRTGNVDFGGMLLSSMRMVGSMICCPSRDNPWLLHYPGVLRRDEFGVRRFRAGCGRIRLNGSDGQCGFWSGF